MELPFVPRTEGTPKLPFSPADIASAQTAASALTHQTGQPVRFAVPLGMQGPGGKAWGGLVVVQPGDGSEFWLELRKVPYRSFVFSKSVFIAELYFTFPGGRAGLLCQVARATAYDAIAAAFGDSTVEALQAGRIRELPDGRWMCST